MTSYGVIHADGAGLIDAELMLPARLAAKRFCDCGDGFFHLYLPRLSAPANGCDVVITVPIVTIGYTHVDNFFNLFFPDSEMNPSDIPASSQMNMTPSEALTTARAMLDNKHCIFSPREYREVIQTLLLYAHIPQFVAWHTLRNWTPGDFLDEPWTDLPADEYQRGYAT